MAERGIQKDTEVRSVSQDSSLKTAIQLLRAALETAPNPRVTDGPPSMWEWFDKTRADALDLTKDL